MGIWSKLSKNMVKITYFIDRFEILSPKTGFSIDFLDKVWYNGRIEHHLACMIWLNSGGRGAEKVRRSPPFGPGMVISSAPAWRKSRGISWGWSLARSISFSDLVLSLDLLVPSP